jgi:hypothetical protein
MKEDAISASCCAHWWQANLGCHRIGRLPRVLPLRTLIFHPALYGSWAVFVAGSLVVTYYSDPYVFGFGTMILTAISAVIGAVGAAGAIVVKPITPRARVLIGISLVLVAGMLTAAFVTLSGFKWA